MPKIRYKKIRLGPDKLAIVEAADQIIARYQRNGIDLSLRQLWYRFVAEDLLPESWATGSDGSKNTQKNYKKLGDIIGDARMAGLLDWEGLEDRGRSLDSVSHWDNVFDIVDSCAKSFRLDKWIDQKNRVEVWVEKDALVGIVSSAAHALDTAAFSCRGYASLTSLWEASQRLRQYILKGQRPVILHLGDHDPSGIDMTRDISDRVNHFIFIDLLNAVRRKQPTLQDLPDGARGQAYCKQISEDYELDMEVIDESKYVEVTRIALTMEQVEQYNPPPNPAKQTDARYEKYKALYGEECWELDALEPSDLTDLITEAIEGLMDEKKYEKLFKEEKMHRSRLATTAEHWDHGLSEVVAKFRPKGTK